MNAEAATAEVTVDVRRSRWRWIAGLSLALLAIALLYLFVPPDADRFASHPRPLQGFAAALGRVKAMQAADSMRLLPECTTRLLSHGEKTLNAVVFFHGYTSCPAEFAQLAELVFGEGRNVLVVPMPLHGLPDRMTEEHSKLRVDMLVAYADSVIDVAQGLGYSVSVAGLSAGGLLAAWAAQNRADVAQAMLISPVIGYEVVPPALTLAAGRLFALLPDRFVWWNPGKREALGPGYAYPRYSHHALAQLLVLGEAVLRDARTNGPATNELIVVTNGNDHDVSAHRIRQLVDAWRKAARARVRTYEFAADLGLGHSLIEPSEPGQRPDLVYPKLLELFRW